MYLNQKLRIRWNSTHSQYFNVSNGVKQGGVISPILFYIYMVRLLNDDIYNFNASKCESDFNQQSNIVFANFKLTLT